MEKGSSPDIWKKADINQQKVRKIIFKHRKYYTTGPEIIIC